MNEKRPSRQVRELIEKHIRSLLGLEALLLLARDADRRWPPIEVSRELGVAVERAETALEQLSIHGLLGVKLGQDVLYWFEPVSKELADSVMHLESELRERRFAVLSCFEERLPSHARDFADAFHLGGGGAPKGGKNNG